MRPTHAVRKNAQVQLNLTSTRSQSTATYLPAHKKIFPTAYAAQDEPNEEEDAEQNAVTVSAVVGGAGPTLQADSGERRFRPWGRLVV